MRRITKISSRQHPVVQECRRLARGPGEDGSVLLDGDHLLDEALRAGITVRALLTDRPDAALARRAADSGARVFEGSRDAIQAASPVRSPSGSVAIVEWTPAPLDRVWSTSPALVLALIDVQDPGNLGAIIRSADALGATAIVTTPGGADPAGWKALRGGMGGTFRVPVARAPVTDIIREARQRKIRIGATSSAEGEPLHRISLIEPLVILLGNEGAGLPASVTASADLALRIPMKRGAESLNVAAAAALLVYEATRQRDAQLLHV